VHTRYRTVTQQVQDRLQKKNEGDYWIKICFVYYYDIVSNAKSKGYFHVGSESSSNSIVADINSITDLDSVELNLCYEHFTNPFGASPPNFDIDFSLKDRDDVTNYIFTRFKNIALLATYNTFKYKAVICELGKVLGLAQEEIDKLSKTSKQQKTFLNSAETFWNKALQQKNNRLATDYQQEIKKGATKKQQKSNSKK
jgi:DNA polymerase-3 subunit alpha